MALTNFPDGLSSFGIPLMGNGIPTGGGSYFFVDSTYGNDGNDGSWEAPFATIDVANNHCVADRGDVIVVKPGHAETLASAGACTLDTDGVTVWFLGNASERGIITFGTLTTASVVVSGDNVSIIGAIGYGDVDALANPFNITGDGFTGVIEWRDATNAKEAVYAVKATTVSNLTLDLTYKGFTDGSGTTAAICLTEVSGARLTVDAYGKFNTAVARTLTTACTDVELRGTVYKTGVTDGTLTFVDTPTGSTWFAEVWDASAGALYVGGSATSGVMATADPSAIGTNVTALVNGLYGTGVVTWPTAAAYANGISVAEVLGYIQDAVRRGSGTTLAANTSLQDVIGTGITGAAGLTIEAALGTTGTVVTDSATSVLGAIGADNADNAFASTSVAANEDGSVLERLEQIQEAVNKGSGTALATNKSLVDALGTNGTAVTDSAVSVLGAIGANNADNAFSSASVVGNADGSVLERLEYLQGGVANTYVPGLGYRVAKTEDVNVATGDALFTVTGKVLITLWTGEVTNALAAGVTDYKIRVATSNIDLCAASNIGSAAIGFIFQMNSDAGDSVINTASATETADTNGKGLANRVVGKAGGSLTLESNRTAGDAGDEIVHTLFYLPLDNASSVAAAA